MVVFRDQLEELVVTAAQAREYVGELEAEHALAVNTGIAEIPAYMRDLELEIEVWRRVYVTSAVTEIATLRAELSGADLG